MMGADALLNVSEAAAKFRVEESTIRSWILKRKIPFVRMGRRVLIRLSDADSFILNNVVYPDPVSNRR
jgi:excisionase family DNA binding protein